MAIHYFICDGCDTSIQDVTSKGIHRCPKCGCDMRWATNVAIHGNYEHPVHSDSLAIAPSQRAEHERLFPNIRLDKQYRPVFDNFTAHNNYLEKIGAEKVTQRIKPKGKRIA